MEKRLLLQKHKPIFRKGKLISLIGANGIGKSTLLKTVTGILKPLTGDVFINSKNIDKIDTLVLAQEMSLVLTENYLQVISPFLNLLP